MADCGWLCCVFLFVAHVHCHESDEIEKRSSRSPTTSNSTDFPPPLTPLLGTAHPTGAEDVNAKTFEGECLRDLFDKYGTPDGLIDKGGFEKLLAHVGLLGEGDEHDHDDHETLGSDDHGHEHKRAARSLSDPSREQDPSFQDDSASDAVDHRVEKHERNFKNTVQRPRKFIKRSSNSRLRNLQFERKQTGRLASGTLEKKYPSANTKIDKGINVQNDRLVRELDEVWETVTSYPTEDDHDDGLHGDEDHLGDDSHQGDDVHDGIHESCITSESYLAMYGRQVGSKFGLDEEGLYHVCPLLIHQLDSKVCQHVDHDHKDEEKDETLPSLQSTPAQVWGYGFLSITIISLVSLIGILTVPAFKKFPEFYKQLLTFLVALAVGTLAGDAVLHLIPHSFGLHAHEETDSHGSHGDEPGDNHGKSGPPDVVLRGLVVLLGIYFFFMAERLMHIFSDKRKRSSRKEAIKVQMEEQQHAVGERLSDYSDPNRKSQFMESTPMVVALPVTEQEINKKNLTVTENGVTIDTSVYIQDAGQRKLSQQSHQSDNTLHSNHSNHSHHGDEEEAHVHSHDNDDEHHHHHHHYGPEVGKGIASVAWMVIMGDGLHNFSDGLAVGAAFADNLSGGLSTSIAIFCHELPHELGDFAILLSSGMPVKQAVMYSLMSSVLSYIGMFIGIGLSSVESASLWIFALAGGMFLYIALVDMLPEMMHTDSKKGSKLWCHLVLQNIGILTGVSIMLLIALFEEKLISAL